MSPFWRRRLWALGEQGLRAFRAAGWAGALGIGLIAFALAFDVCGNRALADAAVALRRDARALRHPVPAAESARERLERFYARLPSAEILPDILMRLHGYALARGVRLDKTDYRPAAEAATPLERISLEVPARANYLALRAWLGDVSAEMPEISLELLSLKRARSSDGEVDAQLRFVIYLRRAS